jgi:hypothetical protein
MAKKSGRQNLKNRLDEAVYQLNRCGVLQSCIIHTLVLLVMSLTFFVEEPLKRVRISLSFNDVETASVDSEPVLDILPTTESVSEEDINDSVVDGTISAMDSAQTNDQLAIAEEENLSLTDLNSASLSDPIMSVDTKELDRIVVREPSPKRVSVKTSNKTTNTNSNFSGTNAGGTGLGAGNQVVVDSIGERLKMAGAKTGDVQVSIGWNTIDDIDLHVNFKNNFGLSFINWMSPNGACGGELDVDMNANRTYLTNKPVENVYWPAGKSLDGEYIVGIHHFRNWSGQAVVPVTIIIKVGGSTKVLQVNAVYGQGVTEITRFSKVGSAK